MKQNGQMPTQNLKSSTCKGVLPWATPKNKVFCQPCTKAEYYTQKCKSDSSQRSDDQSDTSPGDSKDSIMDDQRSKLTEGCFINSDPV